MEKENNDSGVVYVAIVTTGSYEDYTENSIFCSTDKKKVKDWVKKLNKIIDNNIDRIKNYIIDDNLPYWYDYLKWEYPSAIMREIPIR